MVDTNKVRYAASLLDSATDSLEWLGRIPGKDPFTEMKIRPTVNMQNCATGVTGGRDVQTYLDRALAEMQEDLLARARALARQDMKKAKDDLAHLVHG